MKEKGNLFLWPSQEKCQMSHTSVLPIAEAVPPPQWFLQSNHIFFIATCSNSLLIAPAYNAASTDWSTHWLGKTLHTHWLLSFVCRYWHPPSKSKPKIRTTGQENGEERVILMAETSHENDHFPWEQGYQGATGGPLAKESLRHIRHCTTPPLLGKQKYFSLDLGKSLCEQQILSKFFLGIGRGAVPLYLGNLLQLKNAWMLASHLDECVFLWRHHWSAC